MSEQTPADVGDAQPGEERRHDDQDQTTMDRVPISESRGVLVALAITPALAALAGMAYQLLAR